MITVPCFVARTCRAVFRRLPAGRCPRNKHLSVGLQAGPEGLRLRCATEGVAAEYLHRVPAAQAQTVLPLDALGEIEGRSGEATVIPQKDGALVRWSKAGTPQERTYHLDGPTVPDFPVWPGGATENPAELLQALDRAGQIAPRESVRYALERLLLRGQKGAIVATDGRQLLMEGGFSFPWGEDLVVHRSGVFGAPELPRDGAVQVARTADHVLIRTGDWTIALQVTRGERYPNVDSVIPSGRQGATVWRLGAGEDQALVHKLPELPGNGDEHAAVTIDLRKSVRLRARAGQGRPVEITLADSHVEGKPIRVATNRTYLARACELGFRTFVLAEGKPIVCRDGQRVYLWVPLDPKDAVPPQAFTVHVPLTENGSPEAEESAVPIRESEPTRPAAAPAAVKLVDRPDGRAAGLLGLLPLWSAQLRGLSNLVRQQRRRERGDEE